PWWERATRAAHDRTRRQPRAQGGEASAEVGKLMEPPPLTLTAIGAEWLRAVLSGPCRREQAAQPPLEILTIVFSHCIMGYGSADCVEVHSHPGPTFRRAEPPGLGLRCPQHVGERASRSQHLGDCRRTAGTHEVVWILTLRQGRKQKALARRKLRQGKI